MKTEAIEILEKNKIVKEVKTQATEGCCGGAPTQNEDACCKLDEEKKAIGEEGCGCNTTTESSKTTAKSSCC